MQAVANSGATDTMLPEYDACISNHCQVNCWVTLGNITRLPILGEGSNKMHLKSKVIILCN
jgi:hypothetical protein